MLEKIKNNYLLIGILVAAAALRIYHIDFQSIWLDEIHTMIEGNPKMPFKEFYDITVFREQMPHFYFWCIKGFSFIFGHTTFTVRLFSALVGVLSIYAIYLLACQMYNKKAGIIAAALLSVNYFHIWYSQEGRPYILLSLFVILSFYRLIIFIKKSSLKNALLYALFTNMMINTHFFGLFVLVSQSLIILFFIFDLPKKERLHFFKWNALAGIAVLIFWYPSFKIFLSVMEIKSFWIQAPILEVYSQFFKDFFGNAEMVLLIVLLTGVFYFVGVFNQEKNKKQLYKEVPELFSFIVLVIWIFVTLFIPFIRTYLDIPMLISRYFIGVLPAVIIILAIGIARIKNQMVQITVISLFILVSLTDVIIVKDYYNKISKTQFREITTNMIEKNTNKDKIVSSFGWLMGYFFDGGKAYPSTIEGSLKDYISVMRTNKAMTLESFWYMDGNARPYELAPEDEQFLNGNFYVEEDLSYFDTWAKHYVSKNKSKTSKVEVGNDGILSLKLFKSTTLDANGNVALYENANLLSEFLMIEKGNYKLIIKGTSLPSKPINNENAHFKIKINGRKIGQFYMSENPSKLENVLEFTQEKDENSRLQITYDNDIFENGQDRNAIITGISLEKK